MSNLRQNITSPIGRMVWGSMVEPQTKDADGNPLVIKNGPDAGKPTQRYAFGLAVAKAAGQTHWANKPADWDTNPATAGQPYWGAQIWAVGHAAFPNGQAQRPDFSFKVTDGDSQIPNKRGKRPCDQEGYAGHWIIAFSSTYAPRTFNANGTAPVEPSAIKCGHYIQVAGTVDTNESTQNPGVYVNHSLVAHSGFGKEIITGPDPTSVGFGKGPAPVGMSQIPVGGLPAAPGTPAAPAAPAAALPAPPAAATPLPAPTPPAPAAAAPAAPAAPLPAATAVVPHPGILNAAPVPPAPAAPTGPQLTAKANGATYAQLLAAGWTDATLRTHGLMV